MRLKKEKMGKRRLNYVFIEFTEGAFISLLPFELKETAVDFIGTCAVPLPLLKCCLIENLL